MLNTQFHDGFQTNSETTTSALPNITKNPLDVTNLGNNKGANTTALQDETVNAWMNSHSGKNNQVNGDGSSAVLGCNDTLMSEENNVQVDANKAQDPLIGGKDVSTGGIDTDLSNTGDTYYVSPDGSDSNPGTIDKPWKTVKFAVSEKSPITAGDTVLVQPGTYTEIVTLGKSGDDKSGHITLKANGDVTLRDPDPINGDFREGIIESAGKGYWVIDGFRLENSSWAGIALRDANNMIVQNNHTYETGASGIIVLPETYYDGGEKEVVNKDIKVLNNTIERANWRWSGGNDQTGTQEALSIWGVDGFEVAYNTLKEGKREGLDVKTGSRNGSVHNNSITRQAIIAGTPGGYNGGPALYVDGNRADSFNIDIYENVVFNNTAEGILIGDEVPNQGDVRDIRVFNNVVYGNGIQGVNGGRGISVTSNVRDVEILNNTLVKNVQGVTIEGSDFTGGYPTRDVVVRNNIIADSTYLNGVVKDAYNITMDHNLFTNTQHDKLYETFGTQVGVNAQDNIAVKSLELGDDYRLKADSPAINAGSSAIGEYAKYDKDGNERPNGAVDIGAYEFTNANKNSAVGGDNDTLTNNDTNDTNVPVDANPAPLGGGNGTNVPVDANQTQNPQTGGGKDKELSNTGDTYYVSPDGSDSNPGTIDKPWKTVKFAVSEKSPITAGDTVLVQPGTYTEIVTLGKSGDDKSGHITLKANGDVTLRDPDPINGGFREGVIESAGKGYWVIDGFRIENTSWAGISLRDANNMIVQNNHTYETGSSGIIVLPDTYYDGGEKEVVNRDIKVLNNTIQRDNWRWAGRGDEASSSQEAISIWGVDGFEVAYNTLLEGKREGIDAKTGSRNGSIHNNSITRQAILSGTPGGYNGGPALYVDGNRADTFNIDIYDNVVFNNTAEGISIGDEVPNQGDVRDIRVFNNVVYGNGIQGINSGRGISVSSNVRDVEILNNTLVNNVQGFTIDGSDFTGGYPTNDVVIRNNIIADSTYLNGVIKDAYDITLDHNLFTDKHDKLYEVVGAVGVNAKDNITVKSLEFGDDYRLKADSPAIDAGSSAIGEYAKYDKDGKERPNGAVDIGAYEY